MRVLSLLLVFAVPPPTWAAEGQAAKVAVGEVRKVFDNGEHNAFTDLAVFENALYLAFRTCPDGHGVSPAASVIILRSEDANDWEQVARFAVPKRDTRDPHFLAFKGKLFVYTGTWFSGDAPAQELEMNQHLGYAVWSDDGLSWSEPTLLEGTFGHYVWRAAAFGDKAFLCARRKIGFEVGSKGEPREMESLMLESDDGLLWRKRSTFQEIDGDETAFLFERDGGVLGVGRRRGTAQLLRAAPPYTEWQRLDLDRHLGGPLIAKWRGRTLVGGRHTTDRGPKTSLCWLVGDELQEFAELPSGGDNSYPGFVAITPSEALVSWYSSHEGNASIYTATLRLEDDTTAFDERQRAALARGDALLSYQRANGGFPRGAGSRAPLHFSARLRNRFTHDRTDTTLDNGATHREIRELAGCYDATKLPRFRHGCEAGLEFLFAAQYEHGGWPQRYPLSSGYGRHITFNDGAMVGALSVLSDVAAGREPFEWADDELRARAAESVGRGIDCILRCQIAVHGTLTAWGQQHDESSFEPRPARSFEPVSICSAESVGVLEFLMAIESPSPEVTIAVESAVAWLDGPARLDVSRIDRKVLKRRFGKQQLGSVWSRLYEIGTNRPVFGDRDGKVYYDVSDISEERQRGYAWYVLSPRQLLERDYPQWRARIADRSNE